MHAAWRLYLGGMSVRLIAEAGWQTWGFKTRASAQRSLFHAFRAEGFPLRSHEHAIQLRDRRLARERQGSLEPLLGPGYCQGRKVSYPGRGEPCRRRVAAGRRFCACHDPERRGELVESRAANVERARAVMLENARAGSFRGRRLSA